MCSSSAPRRRLVWEAQCCGRDLKLPVFLEVFSGCGRLAKTVAHYCSSCVLVWDITMGEKYDLSIRSIQLIIFAWITSGMIWGMQFGTPCESFTRAHVMIIRWAFLT